jgi:hypothetical protein
LKVAYLYTIAFLPKISDGVPANKTAFYVTLKDFFTTAFGIPFSKYIEMTDDEVPQVKVCAIYHFKVYLFSMMIY